MFKFLSHNYNIILLTKYNYKDFDEDSRNCGKASANRGRCEPDGDYPVPNITSESQAESGISAIKPCRGLPVTEGSINNESWSDLMGGCGELSPSR